MLAGHTAVSAGLSPPHACKQRSWELQLALAVIGGAVLGLISGLRPGSLFDRVMRALPGGSARYGMLWMAVLLLLGWPATLSMSLAYLWGSVPLLTLDTDTPAAEIGPFLIGLWPFPFAVLHLAGMLIVIDLTAAPLLALLIIGGVARTVRTEALRVSLAVHASPGSEREPSEYRSLARHPLSPNPPIEA